MTFSSICVIENLFKFTIAPDGFHGSSTRELLWIENPKNI